MKKSKALPYDIDENLTIVHTNYVQTTLPDGRLGFGKTEKDAINRARLQTVQKIE